MNQNNTAPTLHAVCVKNTFGIITLYRDRHAAGFFGDILRADVAPAFPLRQACALRVVAYGGERLDLAPLDLPVLLMVKDGHAEADATALDAALQQQERNGFPLAYAATAKDGETVTEWELWTGAGIIVQCAAFLPPTKAA